MTVYGKLELHIFKNKDKGEKLTIKLVYFGCHPVPLLGNDRLNKRKGFNLLGPQAGKLCKRICYYELFSEIVNYLRT